MSRPHGLLLLRGAWLGLLVWPYAVASGVPRPLALALLPLALAVTSGGGVWRYGLRVLLALALGAVASLHVVSTANLSHLLTVADLRALTELVTSLLLWLTALLGWQVYRDATSRTRILWLWLMGTLVLALNQRLWGFAAELPTLAYVGIGLFLLAEAQQTRIRWSLAIAALLPLAGAAAGFLVPPGAPQALIQSEARALNLSGLKVAITPGRVPSRVDINRPVSLSATPLLTIRGVPSPSYWQEAIYDDFNGSSWVAPSGAATPLPASGPLLPAAASGLPTAIWHVRVSQFVSGSIGPVIYAGTPLSLESDGSTAYEVPASRALYLPGVSSYGLTLSVPKFSEAAMDAASYPAAAKIPPSDLAVPKALRAELSPLAAELRAGTRSPWQLAQRIANYLDTHEAYDPNFSPSAKADPVGRFLLRTHSGYCDQFSTAFIMLARIGGLPARWVVGFAPGSYSAKSQSEVLLARDAHSWAEIEVAPYGWVPIDPTPSAAPTGPAHPAKPHATPPPRIAPEGDVLAALLALLLAAAAFLTWRRQPSPRLRIERLERGFARLCPLTDRRPPTLRERFYAQPEPLQSDLLPVLALLEQARYGEALPGEPALALAEQALSAAQRTSRALRRGKA